MIWIVIQAVLLGALLLAAVTNFGPPIGAGRTVATSIAGTLLIAIALLIAGIAFRDLGAAVRVRPQPRSGVRLVERGIYGWLRHPMYTAVVATAAGLALREATWPTAAAALAVIAFYLIKARHEEGLLLATYPEYAAYRRRTFGVLPFGRRSPRPSDSGPRVG